MANATIEFKLYQELCPEWDASFIGGDVEVVRHVRQWPGPC